MILDLIDAEGQQRKALVEKGRGKTDSVYLLSYPANKAGEYEGPPQRLKAGRSDEWYQRLNGKTVSEMQNTVSQAQYHDLTWE